MSDLNEWFFRSGALARDGWESIVDTAISGWHHTGVRVGDLSADRSLELPAADVERVIVPLHGSCQVEYASADGSGDQPLSGRTSVFHGPADALYLPTGAHARLSSEAAARVSVSEAPTTEHRPVQHLPKAQVPVELRGSGRASRQVHNFATPNGLDCVRIIACEVITPAENWSSYPPHKHDEHVPGSESRLEEIYYFETAAARTVHAPSDAQPFGMFATYSSGAEKISTRQMVTSGDIALVPYGFHGPAAAAPGYDLYYLNVMAGPDPERVWLISDDPAHGWVRQAWEGQEFDARLPYVEAGEDTAVGEDSAS